jgi:hypothetical protein
LRAAACQALHSWTSGASFERLPCTGTSERPKARHQCSKTDAGQSIDNGVYGYVDRRSPVLDDR